MNRATLIVSGPGKGAWQTPGVPIGRRTMFVQLNEQNRKRIEESIIAFSAFNGSGELELQGTPQDLSRPSGDVYRFLHSETYRLTFPDSVPIIAIPADIRFRNAAGEYTANWVCQGQTVIATQCRPNTERLDAV